MNWWVDQRDRLRHHEVQQVNLSKKKEKTNLLKGSPQSESLDTKRWNAVHLLAEAAKLRGTCRHHPGLIVPSRTTFPVNVSRAQGLTEKAFIMLRHVTCAYVLAWFTRDHGLSIFVKTVKVFALTWTKRESKKKGKSVVLLLYTNFILKFLTRFEIRGAMIEVRTTRDREMSMLKAEIKTTLQTSGTFLSRPSRNPVETNVCDNLVYSSVLVPLKASNTKNMVWSVSPLPHY